MVNSGITFDLAIENYWNYYLELEKSVLYTKRFVAFSPENYGTFSLEYLKLLEAACSEVDSLGKALASIVDSTFCIDKKAGINYWWETIQDRIAFRLSFWDSSRECRAVGVSLDDCEFRVLGLYPLRPWEGYRVEGGSSISPINNANTIPVWWSGYTTVKHRRSLFDAGQKRCNYSKANLGNVLNSMAALYSLNNALLGEIGNDLELEKFIDDSVLFRERETRLANSEFLEYMGMK